MNLGKLLRFSADILDMFLWGILSRIDFFFYLEGTRLAIFSEINEGRQIDSAILKNLTGRDDIAARSLFSNDIKNFAPTHSIVLQDLLKP